MTAFLHASHAGVLAYSTARRIDSASTPTVTLLSAAGAVLVAEGPATWLAPIALSAAALEGATELELSSVTGLEVGGIYYLQRANGEGEFVTVASIDSVAVTVTLRHALSLDYASGDTLESRKLSISVLSTAFPVPRLNCRALWSYKSGTRTLSEESVFHVSRYSVAHSVTPEDIARRYPRVSSFLSSRQELSELIEDIWTFEVLSDFGLLFRADALLSPDSLRTALIERVIAHIVGSNSEWEEYDRRIELYRNALARSISTQPIDANSDGRIDGADEGEKLHPWVLKVGRG